MTEKLTIECECGWAAEFDKSQSGLEIECPECGKIHRLPTFCGKEESVDMATLNRLLGRENTTAAPTTLNFAPVFKLSCAVGVLLIIIAVVFMRGSLATMLGVAGIGLGWPLGVGWAWFSQRRYLHKSAAEL